MFYISVKNVQVKKKIYSSGAADVHVLPKFSYADDRNKVGLKTIEIKNGCCQYGILMYGGET